MADEHWEFTVTVPAGTTQAVPLVADISTPIRVIDKIQWMIPPGASGFTGFRLSSAGVQVIPANKGAWIIRDGSIDGTALTRLHTSGKWDVTAYNAGTHPHTIYVTFYTALVVPKPVVPVPFGLDELQQTVSAGLIHPVTERPLWHS